VLSWDAPGSCMIFAPGARLALEILPRIFSHSSIPAFTRQLSVRVPAIIAAENSWLQQTYGFRHLSTTEVLDTFSQETIAQPLKNLSAWSHPHFTRDDSSTLHLLMPRPSRARAQVKLHKADALVKAALRDRELMRRKAAFLCGSSPAEALPQS
jgi:hypothetical protein